MHIYTLILIFWDLKYVALEDKYFIYFSKWFFILTFVFPCVTSTITIDNQQDATILIYLL